MMDYKDYFQNHPVFRIVELKTHAEKNGYTLSNSSCSAMLAYHCKKKTLSRVRKGMYAVKNGFDHKDTSPFAIAGKATQDAIIAYHTALESHQIAYTHFNRHTFLANRSTLTFDFEGQHYHSVRNPNHSNDSADASSIETVIIEGTAIKRTCLARTIVDVLDRMPLSGGWEEVWRSLDHLISFDVDFAIRYALSLQKSSIAAKLGYFLEQRPAHLPIEHTMIDRLKPYIPKQTYYIDRQLPKENRVHINQWMLVIPRHLHERTWEEPNHDTNF